MFFVHCSFPVNNTRHATVCTRCLWVSVYLCGSLLFVALHSSCATRSLYIYALSLRGLILLSGNMHPNPGPAAEVVNKVAEIPFHRLRLVNIAADGHFFLNGVCHSLHNHIDRSMSCDVLISVIWD